MKIINPMNIKNSDCPVVVLVAHNNKFISWIIRWRTKGAYNHAMIMTWIGSVISQDLFLKRQPIEKYMKKGYKLKFWKVKLTPGEHETFYMAMNMDIARPLWQRRYDFLGVLGQAIGLRRLQNPFRNFCSESVAKYLRLIFQGIPAQPSPRDLNKLFKQREEFELLGYWIAED